MRGRRCGHTCEMPLDIGPSEPLPWLFHGYDDATRGVGSVEEHLTTPNQGALLTIGVDPECVTTNGHFLGWISRPYRENARMKSWQTRDETRLLRMEVFHHDSFVVA